MNDWSWTISEIELVTYHNTLSFIEFLAVGIHSNIPEPGLGMKHLGFLLLKSLLSFPLKKSSFINYKAFQLILIPGRSFQLIYSLSTAI